MMSLDTVNIPFKGNITIILANLIMKELAPLHILLKKETICRTAVLF